MAMAMCVARRYVAFLTISPKKFRTEKLKSSHHHKTHTYTDTVAPPAAPAPAVNTYKSTERTWTEQTIDKKPLYYIKKLRKVGKKLRVFFHSIFRLTFVHTNTPTHISSNWEKDRCAEHKNKWVKLLKLLCFAVFLIYTQFSLSITFYSIPSTVCSHKFTTIIIKLQQLSLWLWWLLLLLLLLFSRYWYQWFQYEPEFVNEIYLPKFPDVIRCFSRSNSLASFFPAPQKILSLYMNEFTYT